MIPAVKLGKWGKCGNGYTCRMFYKKPFRTPENTIFLRTYINRILYFSRLFKNIRYRLEDMGQCAGSIEEDDDEDVDNDDDDENHDDNDNHDHDNYNDNDNIEKEEAKAVPTSGRSQVGGRRVARGGGSTPHPPAADDNGRRRRQRRQQRRRR